VLKGRSHGENPLGPLDFDVTEPVVNDLGKGSSDAAGFSLSGLRPPFKTHAPHIRPQKRYGRLSRVDGTIAGKVGEGERSAQGRKLRHRLADPEKRPYVKGDSRSRTSCDERTLGFSWAAIAPRVRNSLGHAGKNGQGRSRLFETHGREPKDEKKRLPA